MIVPGILQVVENVSFGLSLIQELLQEGLPVQPVQADKSKLARALCLQPRYESGMVYHRRGAHWLPDFEDEVLAFPNAKHDDQVDVAAYAALQIAQGGDFGCCVWGAEPSVLSPIDRLLRD